MSNTNRVYWTPEEVFALATAYFLAINFGDPVPNHMRLKLFNEVQAEVLEPHRRRRLNAVTVWGTEMDEAMEALEAEFVRITQVELPEVQLSEQEMRISTVTNMFEHAVRAFTAPADELLHKLEVRIAGIEELLLHVADRMDNIQVRAAVEVKTVPWVADAKKAEELPALTVVGCSVDIAKHLKQVYTNLAELRFIQGTSLRAVQRLSDGNKILVGRHNFHAVKAILQRSKLPHTVVSESAVSAWDSAVRQALFEQPA